MWTHRSAAIPPFRIQHGGKVKLLPYNDNGKPLMIKQILCSNDEEASYHVTGGSIPLNHHHPNICPTVDCVREKRIGGYYVYIVMPRMHGSLQDDSNSRAKTQSQGNYPEETLYKYFIMLLDAFAYLQSIEIAHRDVKPDNILLDENKENVYICDFGCAKKMNINPKALNTLIGTYQFLSPKLREGLIQGSQSFSDVPHNVYKSDVYSLGMTMLCLTLLDQPKELTTLAQLEAKINAKLAEITGYSRWWVELLRRMLTVNEDSRPDFLQLKEELQGGEFRDDETIEAMRVEIFEKPLIVKMTCGMSFLRMGPERSEEMPCLLSLKAGSEMMRTYSIDIVCVIDLSGSMEGELFTALKSSLCQLIDQLQISDRLCLITFSNTATRWCPLRACVPETKNTLKEIVQQFRPDDLTNISEGFTLALDVLKQRRVKNSAAAILLFTDGFDTVCVDSRDRCINALTNSQIQDLNVHCFGFGTKLDGGFLEGLAQASSGQFQQLSSADKIEEAFSMAVQATLSVVARKVKIKFTPTSDSYTEIKAVLSANNELNFSMADVSVSSPKEVSLVVRANHGLLQSPIEVKVADVSVEFVDSEGIPGHESVELKVQLKPWSDTRPTLVQPVFSSWWRAKGAIELCRARALAIANRLSEANAVLWTASQNLRSCEFADTEPVKAILKSLQETMGSMSSESAFQQDSARIISIIYSHISQNHSVNTSSKKKPE